jgi:hypothetical protein
MLYPLDGVSLVHLHFDSRALSVLAISRVIDDHGFDTEFGVNHHFSDAALLYLVGSLTGIASLFEFLCIYVCIVCMPLTSHLIVW